MTTTENASGWKSFTTGAAIVEGQRITIDSGGLAQVSGVADLSIGFATHAAASGALVTVKLLNSEGTFLAVAASAIVAGAQLYPAASGKVDDTGTTAILFIALEAAAAAGNIIEIAPCVIGA